MVLLLTFVTGVSTFLLYTIANGLIQYQAKKKFDFYSKENAKERLKNCPVTISECHDSAIYNLDDYVLWLRLNLCYKTKNGLQYLKLTDRDFNRIAKTMEFLFDIDKINIGNEFLHSLMFDKSLYNTTGEKVYAVNYTGAFDRRVHDFDSLNMVNDETKVLDVKSPAILQKS